MPFDLELARVGDLRTGESLVNGGSLFTRAFSKDNKSRRTFCGEDGLLRRAHRDLGSQVL